MTPRRATERFVGLDLKRCWAVKSGKDEEATETRYLSPVLEYQSTATMRCVDLLNVANELCLNFGISFADDHPDLINLNFNEDNLHLYIIHFIFPSLLRLTL